MFLLAITSAAPVEEEIGNQIQANNADWINDAVANGGYLYKDEDGEEDVFWDAEEGDLEEGSNDVDAESLEVDENGELKVNTKCGKKGKKRGKKGWGRK